MIQWVDEIQRSEQLSRLIEVFMSAETTDAVSDLKVIEDWSASCPPSLNSFPLIAAGIL